MKGYLFLIVLFIVSLFFLKSSSYYFFPSDILNYLPSFSIQSWERPHNYLLADPLYQFEPWRHFAKEELSNGIFPLWNNLNAGGVPFFANPQTAVLYPLNFIYYIFDPQIALYLIPFFKLFLFCLFTYLYLRSLKVSNFTSIVGGVLALSVTFVTVWLLWPHSNVFILFPLLLLFTEKIRSESNIKWFVLLSITYCIGIFGGHPETLAQIFLAHLFYCMFRFWEDKTKIYKILVSIIIGFCLGAVQLFPFFEYLLNSYAFHERGLGGRVTGLPLESIIFNVFPFLLGAPHLSNYKPITNATNFQEMIGGYVGILAILIILIYILRYHRERIIIFWVSLAFLSFIVSYQIWPISSFFTLPFLHGFTIERFVGIGGFSIIILCSLIFEKYLKENTSFKKNYKRTYKLISIFICIAFIAVFFVSLRIFHSFIGTYNDFFIMLCKHVLFIIVSTILGLGLIIFNKTHKKIVVIVVTVLVLLQTQGLFYSYNPLTKKEGYYPITHLINVLKNQPKGNILEIGNPNLPSDINLIYNLQQIENDDALQIEDFKKAFDLSFLYKNQWNKVENIKIENLNKFFIKYVVTDYNILGSKISLQNKHTTLLPPLIQGSSYNIPFKTKEKYFTGIRILTANFNRKNNCVVTITLKEENKDISSRNILCEDVRDNMYYSVEFLPVKLADSNYEITITSNSKNTKNAIALWGNNENKPYIDLLTTKSNSANNVFKLLYKEKSVYAWKVLDKNSSNEIISRNDSTTKTKIVINKKNKKVLIIDRTFYPGWKVMLDGKKVTLLNTHPFMAVLVPQGKHLVEFYYEPRTFYVGLLISVVTLLASIVTLLRNNSWFR